MMTRLFLIMTAVLAVAGAAAAQTPQPATPSHNLQWRQGAPDLATAQGYSYVPVVDQLRGTAAFVGVTCTGTASPFTCRVPIMALTPGDHSIQIVAQAPPVNGAVQESPVSPVLVVRMILAPAAPTDLSVVQVP
jgi:hypothetical protein